MKDRDSFLDIAKGLAIILVVIGHVIQGSAENFDDLLGFKIIYSFHMPLFIFLSGAVASIAYRSELVKGGLNSGYQIAKLKLGKSAIRLLLPFIAWCAVSQLINHHSDGVFSALVLAFRRPDTALWFLLAIFYCSLLTSFFQLLFAGIYQLIRLVKPSSTHAMGLIADGRVQVLLMILIWWLIRGHTPHGAGLVLLKPYFIYYVLGMGFYKYARQNFSNIAFGVASLIFVCLVPFWLRVAQDQFSGAFQLLPVISYFYAGVVAISGTFLILGLAKAFNGSKATWVKSFLIVCGQLSLGIYAIHYYFLAYSPKVVVPLLASIAITFALNKIPGIRTIFLGERWGLKKRSAT